MHSFNNEQGLPLGSPVHVEERRKLQEKKLLASRTFNLWLNYGPLLAA
jgi:hypothetical protein